MSSSAVITKETSAERFARWKADKEKRRQQLLSQQMQLEAMKSEAKNKTTAMSSQSVRKVSGKGAAHRRSPRLPVRDRLESWKKLRDEKRDRLIEAQKMRATVQKGAKTMPRKPGLSVAFVKKEVKTACATATSLHIHKHPHGNASERATGTVAMSSKKTTEKTSKVLPDKKKSSLHVSSYGSKLKKSLPQQKVRASSTIVLASKKSSAGSATAAGSNQGLTSWGHSTTGKKMTSKCSTSVSNHLMSVPNRRATYDKSESQTLLTQKIKEAPTQKKSKVETIPRRKLSSLKKDEKTTANNRKPTSSRNVAGTRPSTTKAPLRGKRAPLVLGKTAAIPELKAMSTVKKSSKYRQVASRIDTGLGRKTHKAEATLTSKRKGDVIQPSTSAKRQKMSGPEDSKVLTPILERNTPVLDRRSVKEKLDSWFISHCKPNSCYHMLQRLKNVRSQMEPVEGGLTVTELNLQQEVIAGESADSSEKLDQIFAELLPTIQAESCPLEILHMYLQEMPEELPACLQSAHYWLCKLRLEEVRGDHEAAWQALKDAKQHEAHPVKVITEAETQFIGKFMEGISHGKTPRSDLLEKENVFNSSAVKYCYSQTPLLKRLPAADDATPSSVITPVRRSTRKSRMELPNMLQDHDIIVESLEDLQQNELQKALFVPNEALSLDEED